MPWISQCYSENSVLWSPWQHMLSAISQWMKRQWTGFHWSGRTRIIWLMIKTIITCLDEMNACPNMPYKLCWPTPPMLWWPELCQYLLYLTVVLHINHSKNIYKHNISLTGSPEHQQQPKSNTSCILTMCQDKKPSYYHVQIVSNSLTWPDLLIQTHSALSGQVPILSVWLPRVLFYTDFFLLGTATILSHMSNWK